MRKGDRLLSKDEARKLVKEANRRLKEARVRVSLILQGKDDWISLQATLPPKPDSRRTDSHQQKISLKARALTKADIDEAMNRAKAIDLDLNRGEFSWYDLEGFKDPASKTIGVWLTEFEENWWKTHEKTNPSHVRTWKTGYESCFTSLPKDELLTPETIEEWLEELLEERCFGVRRRTHYIGSLKALSEFAGIDTQWLQKHKKTASIKPINPRNLPTDEEIVQMRNSIENPGWKYIFSLIACYGLRPHEVFFLDRSDFPVIRTHPKTKTGERPIKAIPPEWIEWCREEIYPVESMKDPERTFQKLTPQVTRFFKKKFGRSPYDLRHAFAGRTLRYGISTAVSAKLLGHSEAIHSIVYRAWVSEKTYLDAVDEAIAKKSSPQ